MAHHNRWEDSRPGRLPLLLLLGLFAPGLTVQAQPREGPGQGPRPSRLSPELERFRGLTPAERLKEIEKGVGSKAVFMPADRGDVIVSLLERGTVEPATAHDIFCKVMSRGKEGSAATRIKWVIDDGTIVKKGDVLLKLDDSVIQDELVLAKARLLEAEAARAEAAANLRLARRESEIEVRLAEIEFEAAGIELKASAGQAKALLELKVEAAKLRLERAKAQAEVRLNRAAAEETVRAAALEPATRRLRDLEAEVGQCSLTAPIDGLVVYPAPTASRFGPAAAVIAPGEAVREGQTLLRVCDLKQFAVSTRVHESVITTVRVGQPAEVRVDAYPDRVLRGKVTQIATVAAPADFLSSDIKVYPVTITLDDPVMGLKPGMTAGVRIVTAERKGVLRVPVQAVWSTGQDRRCFVKVGAELIEKQVKIGSSNAYSVEVREGLEEGDLVLVNPLGLLAGPEPRGGDDAKMPKARDGLPPGGVALPADVILVRSVRLPDEGATASRSFVVSYGITAGDLERLAALPEVADVAPIRVIPREVRRPEAARLTNVVVVATTPALADFHTLKPAAGRFLTDDDEQKASNVVVLGRSVAASLFPHEEPVGSSVTIGSHTFQVVGVVEAQKALPGGMVADHDQAVFMPFRTAYARLGANIIQRSAGSRQAEKVDMHAVLMRAKSAEGAGPLAETVRSLLERHHPKRDWQVETGKSR